jgi:hypothetical protein
MPRDIPESDWKTFRGLRTVALERFCERVLTDIGKTASDSARTFHDRYLEIYRLVERRDRELGHAFDAPRRSRAIMQLAAIHSLGLVTSEELLSFTPATQEAINSLSRLTRRDKNARQTRTENGAGEPCQ